MPSLTITTEQALGKSSLKEANERLLLHLVLRYPGISRLEIAARTRLSASAVTTIVDRLSREDWLAEEKKITHAAIGRRPRRLFVKSRARLTAAVEITPFDTTVAITALDGSILDQRVIAAIPDPPAMLSRVRQALWALAAPSQPKLLGVGISVAGNVDPDTGRVIAATNLGWHGVNLFDVIDPRLPVAVYMDNNANLAALAERWFSLPGAPLPADLVFVTLRGGLGAGIIANGQLVRGSAARAGELGHTVLHPEGRRCLCGNQGCWEEYASDRALRRLYEESSGRPAPDALEIVEAARQGVPAACRALEQVARDLALGLGNLIVALNPASVIVDHFAAAGWDLVEPILWSVLRARVPAHWLNGVRLLPSRNAAHSSLLGAAALVLSSYFSWPQATGGHWRVALHTR